MSLPTQYTALSYATIEDSKATSRVLGIAVVYAQTVRYSAWKPRTPVDVRDRCSVAGPLLRRLWPSLLGAIRWRVHIPPRKVCITDAARRLPTSILTRYSQASYCLAAYHTFLHLLRKTGSAVRQPRWRFGPSLVHYSAHGRGHP